MMNTTITGLGTHDTLLRLALHLQELSMSTQKAREAGITVWNNRGGKELILTGCRATEPSHPSPHGEFPRPRRALHTNLSPWARQQRVDPSTPHLPTSPSAAPGGLHTPWEGKPAQAPQGT